MTAIEWADETWNPIVGCNMVSRACDLCYAQKQAYRIEHVLSKSGKRAVPPNYQGVTRMTAHGPRWTGKLTFSASKLNEVSPGQKGKRIFVGSMTDIFHDHVNVAWLDALFARMNECSNHTFMLLTKRPQRMLQLAHRFRWTPNIWAGCTVEDTSPEVLSRVELLRMVPAGVRFLSCEPLTANVAAVLDLTDIHWVIAGGESGDKAEAMRRSNVLALRDKCREGGIPFFFKQWGKFSEAGIARGRTVKGEGVEGKVYHEWPSSPPEAREVHKAIVWSTPRDQYDAIKTITPGFMPPGWEKKKRGAGEFTAWMRENGVSDFQEAGRQKMAFLTPNEAFAFKMRFG